MSQQINHVFTKEDAYKTLEITNTWISNIDAKISFALAFSGVLIGFIFAKGLPNAFKIVSEVSTLEELNGGEIIGAIVVCLLYGVSITSILHFILAIMAKIKNTNNVKSIFFFGSIASMELLDYKSKVNRMTEQEVLSDLQGQIYTNSRICNKKAKCYNMGVKFLVAR
jgi:hypothetical protein